MDDEAPLVGLVTAYLEAEGFDVTAAYDGEQAVRLAREHAPDVIVLDVMLPGIDGIEACRRKRAFSDAYIVMLRRPRSTADSTLPRRFGELTIDAAARGITLAGATVELTPIEFDLLDALSESPRLAFSRRQLLDRVWEPGWFGDEHVVDVHIANLRAKLGDDPRDPRYVKTVRGTGYRMGAG